MDLLVAGAAAGAPADDMMVIESQAVAATPAGSAREAAPAPEPLELPSVSDLEVAAAAAAAAMQAMAELQQGTGGSSGEDSSSDSDSDLSASSSGAESDDEGSSASRQQQAAPGSDTVMAEAATDAAPRSTAAAAGRPLVVQVLAGPDGSVSLALQLSEQQPLAPAAGATASSSSSSSSSEDESSEGESDAGSVDYAQMRELIDKAYKVAEEEDAGPLPSLEEDLGLPGALPALAGVVVSADEPLKQAGSISSVLEGMVVVQGLANARALDQGSVLLLEDRSPIGRVEEVFGPVTEPLYALRYAGPKPVPAGLAAGARVFCTDSLAQLVADSVYTDGGKAAKGGAARRTPADYEPGPEDEEEPYFSDDEAEAEWRRSQGATKRKAEGSGSAPDAREGGSSGRGRGRGRGRFGGGADGQDGHGRGGRGGGGGGRRGGGRGGGLGQHEPSPGFRAHATASQMQRMGLQQGGPGSRPMQQPPQQQPWGNEPPPHGYGPLPPGGPGPWMQGPPPPLRQQMGMGPGSAGLGGMPPYPMQMHHAMQMQHAMQQQQAMQQQGPWMMQQPGGWGPPIQQHPGMPPQPHQQQWGQQQQQQQQQQGWTGFGAAPPPQQP